MLRPSSLHWLSALVVLVGCASASNLAGCATGATDLDETSNDDSGPSSNGPSSTGPAGPGSGGAPAGTGGASTVSSGVGANGGAGPSNSSAASGTSSSSNSTAVSSSAAGTTVAVSSSAVTSSSVASSSSSGGCTPVNVLLDGGFEGGPSSTSWATSSSNYGTPVCDTAGCGVGGGSGPYSGNYWSWFGGADFFALVLPEIGIATQSVVIPAGMATLEFRLEMPVCDSFLDVFEIKIDGQTVFIVDGGDASCGQLGYGLEIVNVSAFANGGVHTIQLIGENNAAFFGPTNFMIDDVALVGCM